MRWLDGITDSKGHESEQTLGDSGGQASLAHCSSWGHRESDIEQQQPMISKHILESTLKTWANNEQMFPFY